MKTNIQNIQNVKNTIEEAYIGEFKDYTDQELSQLIYNLSNPTKEISKDDEKLKRAKIGLSSRVQANMGTI